VTLRRQRRPHDQPLNDPRIDILAEGLAQAFFETQLLDHLVEGDCQLADFVARGGGERSVKVARFDRFGSLQQPADRASYAGADQGRERKTEY
jgi:hypothetical protein